ncbi:hypothetical protein E2C01_043234 [Portunus trituberculatus]|uniref:Uncharacterized protein n=1 Tax=Portunus trituberculatus TaxID=210409 RepID=A0A5B7FZ03_PORTR|nr:hypothetical protein [Portunus trituberculatus]
MKYVVNKADLVCTGAGGTGRRGMGPPHTDMHGLNPRHDYNIPSGGRPQQNQHDLESFMLTISLGVEPSLAFPLFPSMPSPSLSPLHLAIHPCPLCLAIHSYPPPQSPCPPTTLPGFNSPLTF